MKKFILSYQRWPTPEEPLCLVLDRETADSFTEMSIQSSPLVNLSFPIKCRIIQYLDDQSKISFGQTCSTNRKAVLRYFENSPPSISYQLWSWPVSPLNALQSSLKLRRQAVEAVRLMRFSRRILWIGHVSSLPYVSPPAYTHSCARAELKAFVQELTNPDIQIRCICPQDCCKPC